MEVYNLNQPESIQTYSLDAPSPESLPSEETADKRSFKIKYGLGDIIKQTKEEIFKDLSDGNEAVLREKAAGAVDERKSMAVENVIRQATANKGSPLSPAEVFGLQDIVKNLSSTTNPDTVFEEAYAKQFIGELDKASDLSPDNLWKEANKIAPEDLAKIASEHSTGLAKREILVSKLQDVEDEIKHQGWFGWGVDFAKGMVPGYHDAKLRDNVEGSSFFEGGLLGLNLEEQRKRLLSLPTSEMKTELDKIVDTMKRQNPQIAAEFVRAMIGPNDTGIFFNNIVTPLDFVGLGVGKFGTKTIKAAVKTLSKREQQTVKDAETAVRQMAEASTDPNVSKSTIEAASGNLTESATTRLVTDAVEDASGTPDLTRRGIEALSSTHKVDFDKIKSRPGTRGQDIVNRVKETYDQVDSMLQRVSEVAKVERLPDLMANQVAVKAIVERMKDLYGGMKNTIIDSSKPYKEGLANNWYVDFYLGNPDGTYFTHRSTAENFIKEMGFSRAEIGEGAEAAKKSKADVYYLPESAIKTDARTVDTGFNQVIEDGEVKFYMDLERNIEIPASRTPKEGLVPVEVVKDSSASGGVRTVFGKPLASVEQQGLGYYIKISKPIRETDDVVRDYIASTKNTRVPTSGLSAWLNQWIIGRIRTPEDTLSTADRANRLVATYSTSEIVDILTSNSPHINKLASSMPSRFSKGRRKWDEFIRVVENGQELWDTATKQKGVFFNDIEELENAYMSWFKRLPDEDEILAYFEFKRNMEIDRGFRNIAEHRNQTRVGAETQKITSIDEDGNLISTPEFSGVRLQKLPGSKDNVAIFNKDLGYERVVSLGDMSTADKKDWNELIKNEGWKLFEVYDPELKPFKGFGNIGNSHIRYVLAKDVETSELKWDLIPRRGGGHVEYDYAYGIKQAKMELDEISKDNWYRGDFTIALSHSFKNASDFAKKLDHVRKLLRADNDEAAKQYTIDNLHIPWETVQKWFRGSQREDGSFSGGMLSLDEKIEVVNKGDSIGGMTDRLEKNYSRFRDGTKEGSLARQQRVAYSQERDADEVFALDNKGTRGNPLYSLVPAEKVDPITTMNRGLNSIIKSNIMDDYKTMAVEHWLQQAMPFLKGSEKEKRHSPFQVFRDPQFRPDADPKIKAQLETARAHILQLIGQPSDTANKLQRISQKLADTGERIRGPNSVLANEWDLSSIKDPITFIRGMTYHYKMGLFSIPQFIVQMGNYANIFGIAGAKYAGPGTLGAQLHFWSTVNSHPNIINHLDNIASKFKLPFMSGFRPGEFKEAHDLLKKTGFGLVGKEQAMLDDSMSAKLITKGTDSFLNMSSFFVRNGERNSRYGAWYTAYKELRDKKPFGALTDADVSWILQRADLLNINMSRASSSALHTGVMSLPATFLTYQIRLFELFTGNRLTGAEKARLFFTNSLLYGVPMGVGLTGIPAADWLRQQMMEDGSVFGIPVLDEAYVTGDKFIESMFMEGIPSALGAIISGKGDPKAGTWFDIGPRMGTKGLEFFGGINNTDKSQLDILGGPAWSIIKGTIEQSYGFLNVVLNLGKKDSEIFPTTYEDYADIFKEITSVNTAFRTLAILNHGRWVSKKEAWLADATPAQAIISALTSFKDTRIDDIQTIRAAARDQAAYEKKIEDLFLREYRRATIALKDGDNEASKKYFTKANILLHRYGYPVDRINSLIARASHDNRSIQDKVMYNFYTRQHDKQQGLNSLIRTEKVKQRQKEAQ